MSPAHKESNRHIVYVVIAIVVFAIATFIAFTQPASNYLRQSEEGFWTQFIYPNERNSFRRIDGGKYPHARVYGLGDASRLWYVTSKYIVSSNDGGHNWHPAALPVRKHTLYKLGKEEWYAISDALHSIQSTNAGESWGENLRPGGLSKIENLKGESFGFNISEIAFSRDGQFGVAVGGDGYFVQETKNLGQDWVFVSGAPNPLHKSGEYRQLLNAVALSDDGKIGIAVGTLGVVKILNEPEINTKQTQQNSSNTEFIWQYNHQDQTRPKLTDIELSGDGQVGIAVGERKTILRTTDQGNTWIQISPPSEWDRLFTLRSVSMSRDGQTILIAGGNNRGTGVLARSMDSGETWQSVGGKIADIEVRSIRLSDDGLVGFAAGGLFGNNVGVLGKLFKTEDGGRSWKDLSPRQSIVGDATARSWPLLTSLYVSSNAAIVIATTQTGRLLSSLDGGINWSLGPTYIRMPAYWYYLSILVSILFMALAAREVVLSSDSQLADHYESDAPIANPSGDKLQFTPIAESISHYLRNPNTTPPLNLAITAPWGSGKSSLMNLLVEDLKKHSYRTVWFNAWHHQSEEHLLASLLEAIRIDGIPSWWEPEWVLFSLRLLLIRLKRDFQSPRVLLLLLPIVFIFLVPSGINHLQLSISEEAANSIAILAFIPLSGVWIRNRIKALSSEPAKLLLKFSGRMSVKKFREHLGFRHNFSQELKDVTQALRPSSIVVVIDDLDRCKPENILEVLEAINFLMNAGRCFVVFGMDTKPVLASLEIEFKDIAEVLAQDESHSFENAHDYARHYLEKMINIQIPVPPLDSKTSNLFIPKDDSAENGTIIDRKKIMDALRKLSMAIFFMIGIAGFSSLLLWAIVKQAAILEPVGQEIYTVYKDSNNDVDSQEPSRPTTVSANYDVAIDQPEDKNIADGKYDKDLIPEFKGDPIPLPNQGVIQSLSDNALLVWLIPLTTMSVFIVMLSTMGRWRSAVSQDSGEFVKAISKWSPILYETETTPRTLKRFHNRVRLLAMLQDNIDQAKRLPEAMLVALGLLAKQSDDSSNNNIEISGFFDEDGNFDKKNAFKSLKSLSPDALQELANAFEQNSDCQPTPQQLDTFNRLNSGVLIR